MTTRLSSYHLASEGSFDTVSTDSLSEMRALVAEYEADPYGAVLDNWEPREGTIITEVRAISARINQNFDAWPSEELRTAHQTFVGKPVFVNHNNHDPDRARGRVVASRYVDAGENDRYVQVLQEVEATRFPMLAKELLEGGLDSVSMGAEAREVECSYCSNVSTSPFDACEHIPLKGSTLQRRTANGSPEDVLIYEICRKISFFELSYVFDPADETAVASNVLVAGRRAVNEVEVPPKVDTLHPDEDEKSDDDWHEYVDNPNVVDTIDVLDEPDLGLNQQLERPEDEIPEGFEEFEGIDEEIEQNELAEEELAQDARQQSQDKVDQEAEAEAEEKAEQARQNLGVDPAEVDENGDPIVELDENGDPIEQELDEDGNPVEEVSELDEEGNPVKDVPELDENGDPIEEAAELDEYGNPIQYDENGDPIVLDEDGNPVKVKDPEDDEDWDEEDDGAGGKSKSFKGGSVEAMVTDDYGTFNMWVEKNGQLVASDSYTTFQEAKAAAVKVAKNNIEKEPKMARRKTTAPGREASRRKKADLDPLAQQLAAIFQPAGWSPITGEQLDWAKDDLEFYGLIGEFKDWSLEDLGEEVVDRFSPDNAVDAAYSALDYEREEYRQGSLKTSSTHARVADAHADNYSSMSDQELTSAHAELENDLQDGNDESYTIQQMNYIEDEAEKRGLDLWDPNFDPNTASRRKQAGWSNISDHELTSMYAELENDYQDGNTYVAEEMGQIEAEAERRGLDLFDPNFDPNEASLKRKSNRNNGGRRTSRTNDRETSRKESHMAPQRRRRIAADNNKQTPLLEETGIAQTPAPEPVALPEEGDSVANESESDRVKAAREAYRRELALDKARKARRARRQAEAVGEQPVEDDADREDLFEDYPATTMTARLRKRFAAWVRENYGCSLKQASGPGELRSWARAFSKQAGIELPRLHSAIARDVQALRTAKDDEEGVSGDKADDDIPEFIQEKIDGDDDDDDKKESARKAAILRQRRAAQAARNSRGRRRTQTSRRKTADEKLDLAAPGDRVNIEKPTSGTTDEDAEASQFDKADFDNNSGKGLEDVDTTPASGTPGGPSVNDLKRNSVRASGLQAVQLAEAMITVGLIENSSESKFKAAAEFEKMSRDIVLDRTALLGKVAKVPMTARRSSTKSAGNRGTSLNSAVPPNLSGAARSAAPQRREAAADTDSDIFF